MPQLRPNGLVEVILKRNHERALTSPGSKSDSESCQIDTGLRDLKDA